MAVQHHPAPLPRTHPAPLPISCSASATRPCLQRSSAALDDLWHRAYFGQVRNLQPYREKGEGMPCCSGCASVPMLRLALGHSSAHIAVHGCGLQRTTRLHAAAAAAAADDDDDWVARCLLPRSPSRTGWPSASLAPRWGCRCSLASFWTDKVCTAWLLQLALAVPAAAAGVPPRFKQMLSGAASRCGHLHPAAASVACTFVRPPFLLHGPLQVNPAAGGQWALRVDALHQFWAQHLFTRDAGAVRRV